MKVITKDDFYSIPGRASSGAFAPIQEKLETLEIGTALMVEPNDWKVKGYIGQYIALRYKVGKNPKRFVTKKLPNEQGWAILRLA